MKIEMIDIDGNVTEVVTEVHRCVGDSRRCAEPAICEDHGDRATRANPVYSWTCADGMSFFACGRAIAEDRFSRFAE